MSPIGLIHATDSTALGGRVGLDSPGFYNGMTLLRWNIQRAGFPIMFALVALGKGVSLATNKYQLCEVSGTSMTAGYDLDER